MDLGCLGTDLMEVLGGEVDLEVDGFEVTLELEFTWVLVRVKGLGGAGALKEPMDSNSSFPVILTPSIVLWKHQVNPRGSPPGIGWGIYQFSVPEG